MRANRALVLSIGVAGLLTAGCESSHPYRERVRAHEVIVTETPPPPQSEMVPAAPGPGYVWSPGYWTWNHNRWIWESGHYMVIPQGHAAWEPGHWERRGHGWIWEPGHWR